MRQEAGGIRLSATDLANHLGCRHLTDLNVRAAIGELEAPHYHDPALELLQRRGLEHEEAYVKSLLGKGMKVVRLDGSGGPRETLWAMKSGPEAIVQATLAKGRWFGRADILRRVETRSKLGSWSYEVIDTKLARETRAGTILQLSLYSDLLGLIQGQAPEFMYVVPPGEEFHEIAFRVDDHSAYYRLIREKLQAEVDAGQRSQVYPEPVSACDYCRWWRRCDERRRADDHLSLVAGISRMQRRELESMAIGTLAALGQTKLPLPKKPRRGSVKGYHNVVEQARIQLEGRRAQAPVHELLPIAEDQGLNRLPSPSAGDIFFDFEGDPFAGLHGLEYLFGWVAADGGSEAYHKLWATTDQGERLAFEAFIDLVMERWATYPDFHIFHFAPYEPAAIKRLMGRHGTRAVEVDRLLRAGVFVDLHGVTKQALRASVERYSLKDLEAFHGFVRELDLRDASRALRAVERALELGDSGAVSPEMRLEVEQYNRDDCVSTLRLRDWLETLRAELVDAGNELRRPAVSDGQPTDAIDERDQEVAELQANLLAGVSDEPSERTPGQQGQWLLANMLEFHRRELKAVWWEYFRLRDCSEEELLDEKSGLASLEFVERVGGTDRCPVHRYRYALQDTTIRGGHDSYGQDGELVGSFVEIEPRERWVDIKKRSDKADFHPTAVFAHQAVNTDVKAQSLRRLATWVAEHGIGGDGSYSGARSLLCRSFPELAEGSIHRGGDEDVLAHAMRVARLLQNSYLPIQGPPGAGKTYTGARMIRELVSQGRTVGITAVSHKVIRNLLDEVVVAFAEKKLPVRCVQKVREKPAEPSETIRETTSTKTVVKAIVGGTADVAAGTAWLWSREELSESIDVLVVDEAGQMALPEVLAVSQAAKSVILLGDPRQLEQPQQATHPDGVGVSALEHVLDDRMTIPADRGLFLENTWRLHPDICRFTSECFYEGRLRSEAGLSQVELLGPTRFAGAGVHFVPVEHDGNQNTSPEEVDAIVELFDDLLQEGVEWRGPGGDPRAMGHDDILVVAPYNAQVSALSASLPEARIGTVDKFQGQQAAVVIFSLTSSSHEDAPRGMEFLYSLSRLNVATSRARCVCILVGNPIVFEPECRTPRQIQLANAFCRYLEIADSQRTANRGETDD